MRPARDQKTPFMGACSRGSSALIQLMLEHGADPNLSNRAGVSPLKCAPYIPEIYDVLLAAGANINAPVNSEHDSLLMGLAKQPEATAWMKYLLAHGADPNQANLRGYTALHNAVRSEKNIKNIELLLEHKARPNETEFNFNRTPIFLACAYGNWELVPCLLKYGADPKIKDTTGRDCQDLEITSENIGSTKSRVIREYLARTAANRSR